MAKSKDVDDNDDKFEKMDEESLGFLDQARKGKARNFVMSVKGGKVRSLVVKKKKVKENDKKEARGGGFQPVFGVVSGMGAKITFTLARSDGFDDAPGGGKVDKLKKFLKEQTDKAFKPEWEVVDTPPAIPFDEEDLADPLIAKFMKLEPVITKACDQQPTRVGEIEDKVSEIRELLQDDEARASAGPKIDEFVQYLKEMLAGGTETPPVSPSPTEEASPVDAVASPDAAATGAKLVEALKKLKPLMDTVINANPERKGELHGTLAQIAGDIKAKQFDQARDDMVAFGKMLKSLLAGQTPPSGEQAVDVAFADRKAALEPRLLAAQKADRDKATALGNVWNYANEQAAATNFVNANKALDRLEKALNDILNAALGTDEDVAASAQRQYEAAFGEFDSQYMKAIGMNPAEKTKMVAAYGKMLELAEAGSFPTAMKILGRLRPLVEQVLAGTAAKDTDVIPEGVVEQRKKFLQSRWQQAVVQSRIQIDKLRSRILERMPDEDSNGLVDAVQKNLDDFVDDLNNAILGTRNAASNNITPIEEALNVIRNYRSRIQGDPLIQHLKRAKSDLGVDVNVEAQLLGAIDEMENQLAS